MVVEGVGGWGGFLQRESDCTCHNRVALGDTGGELGAGTGGEARLHVLQAAVQGRERVLVRLWTNMQQMQESVSAEKCAKWLDRYSKKKQNMYISHELRMNPCCELDLKALCVTFERYLLVFYGINKCL